MPIHGCPAERRARRLRPVAVPFLVAAWLALAGPLPLLAADHAAPDPARAPGAALTELSAGNRRFVLGEALHAAADPATRTSLATGQKPIAIVIACSDSRVPPELIFDQGLGRLFVIRTAGEIVDSAALASVEYAVLHLGARLILVLGHESCGAVKAALETPRGVCAGSDDLDRLVKQIRRSFRSGSREDGTDPTLRAPVMDNVKRVAADVLTRSEALERKIRAHEIEIAQGIYGLASGRVDVFRVWQ